MKLPIKKQFFDAIQQDKKESDFRDAHITFICEETGRTLRRKVVHVAMMPKNNLPKHLHYLFEDDQVIVFHLSKKSLD